jgi:hypothetical protein
VIPITVAPFFLASRAAAGVGDRDASRSRVEHGRRDELLVGVGRCPARHAEQWEFLLRVLSDDAGGAEADEQDLGGSRKRVDRRLHRRHVERLADMVERGDGVVEDLVHQRVGLVPGADGAVRGRDA